MSRRPRQVDIARTAGVSQATVSLVLNERRDTTARVPEETRERVLSAIKRAGYVVNPLARSLSGRRSNMIGLFTFESIESHPEGFYHSFIEGIMAGCEKAGRDLLMYTSTSRDSTENHIYLENENRLRLADGGILLGNGEPQLELRRLTEDSFPFVFIGRRELGNGNLSWVAPDYTAATDRLVQRLVDLGHDRIGYLGVGLDTPASRDRRLSYARTLRRNDLEVTRPIANRGSAFESALDAIDSGVTAFVVEPPVGMSRFVDAIEAAGLVVPDDVSVALMGDPATTEPRSEEWSGYLLPRRELGLRSVEVLESLIEQPDGTPIQLEFECPDVDGVTVSEVRK